MKNNFLRCYIDNQKAATAIEYALIVGGVALSIATVIFIFGDDITSLFETVSSIFTERS
jgi:Flp pilus assembly pilin Flp